MRIRNQLHGLVATFLVVIATMFIGVSSASAKDTWTPAFDANRHVQVEPGARGWNPAETAKVERELIELGAKHHLQYYLVYTVHGDDKAPAGQDYAAWKLNSMITQWRAQGLPADDYVVVLIVPGATRGHSIAATGGTRMQQWGLDGDYLKNVLASSVSTYMPDDPGGLAVHVARTTNGAVDSYNFKHYTLPKLIVGGIVLVIIIGYLVFLFVMRGRALRARDQWKKYWGDSSDWYDELEGNASGYLRQQKEMLALLEGNDKKRYEATLAQWGDLSIRKVAISDRYHAIEALCTGFTLLPFKFFKVIALATKEPITLSTSALKAADADIFKGIVQDNSVTPEQLLTTSQDQIKAVAAELKAMADAYRDATQNGEDIKRLLGEVDALRPAMTERQLPFAPYQSDFDVLGRERDALLAIIGKQPFTAAADSQRIEDGCEALKARVNRAIGQKDALVKTRATIDGVTQKVTGQRAQAVGFKFPFVEGEQRPAGKTGTFVLDEEKGNPDAHTKSAEQHYAAAQAAVTAGELDKSDEEKAAAEKAASAASALVDSIIAAKAYVESQVPQVRTAHSALKTELPGATTSLATLNAEFLAANFQPVSGNVQAARKVDSDVLTTLESACIAYHNQQFLAAQRTIQALTNGIAGARSGLTSVNTRLAELQTLRTSAKQTAQRATTLSNALSTKLRENAFTTSKATDSAYASAKPALTELNAELAQEKPDYAAAEPEAKRVLAALQKVDGDIDSEKAAHALAEQRAGELQTALAGAERTVQKKYTRTATKGLYDGAVEALAQARRTLGVAKSDWDALVRALNSAKENVATAVSNAATDQREGAEAAAAIDAAAARIGEVEGYSYGRSASVGGSHRSFGSNVSADLSDASSALTAARRLMANEQYVEAERKANAARSEADDANTAAAAIVAAAIQSAINAYEEEQRRIAREAEEAREEAARQARANARSNDDGPSLSRNDSDNTGSVTVDDSPRTGSVQSDDFN